MMAARLASVWKMGRVKLPRKLAGTARAPPPLVDIQLGAFPRRDYLELMPVQFQAGGLVEATKPLRAYSEEPMRG
jgi:hypothetical protein